MKVVVKLQGGMGNQMFQYAFGKRISEETNRELILDLSFLNRRDLGDNFVYRDFDLNIFDFNYNTVNQFDEEYELFVENIEHFNYEGIIGIINNIKKSTSKNVYLDGYWASPLYFSKIEYRLKNKCLDISKDLLFEINNTNSVMLNVRRTDFLNNDFHGVLGKEYILKGIENLSREVKDLKFFIFSDDIEWCENNLNDIPNSIIVNHEHKGKKFSNYLFLMKECKHFVIPNSTFAWWAAYLSENKSKKVFYPEKWLNALDNDLELLYFGLNWNKNTL